MIPLPADTLKLLEPVLDGVDFRGCDSRSLMLERYANPALEKDDRRDFFLHAAKKMPGLDSLGRRDWIEALAGARSFYAQLQSRLMVDMAGGVMENAGLSLDRFGMPYIPGSTLKGCARRMAIQSLLEAEDPKAKADLLVQAALVFGWGDTDWKPGRKPKRKNGESGPAEGYSDFWWAMAEDSGDAKEDAQRDAVWKTVASFAANRLMDRFNARNGRHADEPWKDLPNFAGTVSFLPAYPVDIAGANLPLKPPATGRLELDVVTCHHPDYYSRKTGKDSSPVMPVALDTEDPNPVVFPAVASGHVFSFALAKLHDCPDALLAWAQNWLQHGLEIFGIGAKTNAGYGWFDCSASVNETVERKLSASREEDKARKARGQLEPDAGWQEQFKAMNEVQRRGVINNFAFDDEKWFPKTGPESEERVQFSLLHFLLKIEPEFLADDRAKPKSKIAKALATLSRRFPRLTEN